MAQSGTIWALIGHDPGGVAGATLKGRTVKTGWNIVAATRSFLVAH